MQRFREGIHIRTMKAKRKVEEISKDDIQAFLKKNAFVLFTVGAVIVGAYACASYTETSHFIQSENCQCNIMFHITLSLQVSFWVSHSARIR